MMSLCLNEFRQSAVFQICALPKFKFTKIYPCYKYIFTMTKTTKKSLKWHPNLEGIKKFSEIFQKKSNSAKRASEFPTT